MTTESPLQQALRLNNEAATMVSSKRLADAGQLLRRATELLFAATTTSVPEDAKCAKTNTFHSDIGLVTVTSASDCNRRGHVELCNYNQDDSMYIYDRLFVLSADSTGTTSTTTEPKSCNDKSLLQLSLYILFNLALVHHLSGRVTGNDSMLAKAKALYGQVWRATRDDDDTHDLLQCLVLNGLADIYHEMSEYKASAACMEIVSDIAADSLCLTNSSLIADTEAESLLLNQLFVQYPCAAKAA